MESIRKVVGGTAMLLCFVMLMSGLEYQSEEQLLLPDAITEPITIDGLLSESVWKGPGILRDFHSFSPLYGETLENKTRIWLAYDRESLYFAFYCYDSEPDKIKTKIARRDTIASNDCIGVVLDTMGNRQSSYEFYINPSGIQEDGITSAVNGMNFDGAPDFVWESAGKIQKDGYTVEIKIPLNSLKYKSGKQVDMGIIFMRNVNRLGKFGAWPEMKAGDSQFNAMLKVRYRDLKKGLKLELLPSLTYSINQQRADDQHWDDRDSKTNAGLSVKYGLTSSVSLEGTVNPDFSQIESDAFQMDVNQRYPIFYTEKRPFFMEGMDALDFGLIMNGMMRRVVHTRKIVDPDWAAKISGTSGKMLFNVLAASEGVGGDPAHPHSEGRIFWGIARGKYSLGGDNSIGFIYTGKRGDTSENHVAGIDFQYRFFKNTRFLLSYLNSDSSKNVAESEDSHRKGSGINSMFEYRSPEMDLWGGYERYGTNFRMESAFQNRVGISRFVGYAAKHFYMPRNSAFSWIKRITPFLELSALHDLNSGLNDSLIGPGIDLYFDKRGYFRAVHHREKEAWAGNLFSKTNLSFYGGMQPYKWIIMSASYRWGDRIYYHPADPFIGDGKTITIDLNLQPSEKINVMLAYRHDRLRQKDGESSPDVYRINIYNCQASYQFNRHFFLRAALRYDDYNRKILTDFLASYTLVPGTVAHVGYGALYEDRSWNGQRWESSQGDWHLMRRSLFLKVSYLWRIQ